MTVNQDTENRDDEPVMVFSSDTHVGPPLRVLRPYCESKYLAQFDEYAASPWANAEAYTNALLKTFSPEYRTGFARNVQTLGHYDPHARLRDMDRDGVAGGIIFHNSLNGEPFPLDLKNSFGNGVASKEEQELAGVGRQIYNRWLADFCSVEPERSLGLAQLPMWDIPAAIKELEVAANLGLNGVNFPAPGALGMIQPTDPAYEDFFAAAAALDMTLTSHIGVAPPSDKPLGPLNNEYEHEFTLLDQVEWGQRSIIIFALHGIFERHPNLKLVITEYPGVYWNELKAKMDSVTFSPAIWRKDPLPRLPSEYMAENVWIGNSFQSRAEAVAVVEQGLEDRYMWGSDYPHAEGTFSYSEDPDSYPMTRLALANTYHDLPVDKVRKMAGENALNCFPRLDGKALRKVADRIGPSVEEVTTAPDLSKYSVIGETGTLAFRTMGAWA